MWMKSPDQTRLIMLLYVPPTKTRTEALLHARARNALCSPSLFHQKRTHSTTTASSTLISPNQSLVPGSWQRRGFVVHQRVVEGRGSSGGRCEAQRDGRGFPHVGAGLNFHDGVLYCARCCRVVWLRRRTMRCVADGLCCGSVGWVCCGRLPCDYAAHGYD